MSFPQTRPTLIQRLAASGNDVDWQQFLSDYWGPVCRFAWRSGHCSWQDAEDVASQTFLAIVERKLLVRWAATRAAKLRTLICTVVRHVLANRARILAGRARVMREHGNEIARPVEAPSGSTNASEAGDIFYAAWADHLLEETVDGLVKELHREGKGDQFRVLYDKACEGLPITEIAASLDMTTSQAERAYRSARDRLALRLEAHAREHVRRYAPDSADDAEFESYFAVEWNELARYLKNSGGLENAIRNALEPTKDKNESQASLQEIAKRLTEPRR
ncbi:MAG TPA: sigma-70 family RNA polymerase sigma factor [Gemmataceae bacterium]|jgi:DNA-directed RNA polymerase specialized sigma24 family protein|nr:sigma-70 family RNA polymerase sigma factor [Gemmataceae bacterium]